MLSLAFLAYFTLISLENLFPGLVSYDLNLRTLQLLLLALGVIGAIFERNEPPSKSSPLLAAGFIVLASTTLYFGLEKTALALFLALAIGLIALLTTIGLLWPVNTTAEPAPMFSPMNINFSRRWVFLLPVIIIFVAAIFTPNPERTMAQVPVTGLSQVNKNVTLLLIDGGAGNLKMDRWTEIFTAMGFEKINHSYVAKRSQNGATIMFRVDQEKDANLLATTLSTQYNLLVKAPSDLSDTIVVILGKQR